VSHALRSSSGSLAMLAAIRLASSLVSSLAPGASSRLILEIDVRERLPVGVADDEAGVRLGGPGREAVDNTADAASMGRARAALHGTSQVDIIPCVACSMALTGSPFATPP
jgi:hypothetical protein